MILGTTSPRRREVLSYFSINFRQIPPDFDESTIPFNQDPVAYTTTLAQNKGKSINKKFPDEIILSADTVVYFDKKVYNKPKDLEEAVQFLQELSGNWHQVYTGVAVQQGNAVHTDVACTEILFHKLTEEQIRAYLQFGGHLDKAGGYAIQHCGSLIVRQIVGCYYNVMGLPVGTVRSLLLNVGIDLWDYLQPF